jgi:hypothetical protein
MTTDLIGDVHGHASRLELLLQKLGYRKSDGVYTHPERLAVFLGDYIDRGPEIAETLHIVRSMVEAGSAVALMGNHEYNALCFHYENPEGGHLRKHSIKNFMQHHQTLAQFHNRQKEYEMYLEWFMSLPLYYETDTFRAVHACWDHNSISYIRAYLPDSRLSDAAIREAAREGSLLFDAVEKILKGPEISMPPGQTLTDKDGTIRSEIRIKWWEDPATSTYKSISVIPLDNLPDEALDPEQHNLSGYYKPEEKTVFFGHYWLKGTPVPYRHNVCCLDWSVAKGGQLVACSLKGEKMVSSQNLVSV